ncbi:MFS general substrate transporter [Periconia macrospinosa]|uniref:MFS general substrate transporter n=1 Tax=Periconia macrospinosa TaxID=97972 RepID=A0A2V1E116_9PLEO|nr:MFS general substrate transporter [Periconia macrospinosa]
MARHGGIDGRTRRDPPFPTKQMAILALCRISEPIAFMSIFPYAYFMVESFGIAKTNGEISMYTGMVTSAFAFSECMSGIFWGRLSDRIGRKKVLLGGLFGTGLSMLLFGFATNLYMALFARALGGLLNGNIGVLQTTVAELVTVEKHQPRAYSIMPFVWCLGTIIGATLGGILARPALALPSWFQGTIFDAYPFLLPNLVCTAVVICGLAVGILFLEETHEDRKYDHDRGLDAGRWLLSKLGHDSSDASYAQLTDKDALLLDERDPMLVHPPTSTSSSPTLCSSRPSLSDPPPFHLEKQTTAAPTVRSAFTKQVCLNIVCYGILAFHTISLEQLLPILMSKAEPTGDNRHLPFYFQGGFNFSSQTNGMLLSIQGVLQMIAQLFIFPWISKKLGSLRTFYLTIAFYPFLYLLAPYLALLPKNMRVPGIVLLLVWKVTAQSLSYPSLAIMLANASPSKKVLGTLNGAAAASASVCRGFGPTVSGAVDSVGDRIGMSGLAWWTCAAIAAVGWMPGFFMEEQRKRPGSPGMEDDEEVGLGMGLASSSPDSDAESILTLTPDESTGSVLAK